MELLLSQLISDFQARPIPKLTTRDATPLSLPGKADAIIGMRRAGKTTFLYQQMQRLLDEGVPKQSLLYLNFEDDRLHPVQPHLLPTLLDVFYRREPGLRNRTCHFFFDEIQEVPDWPRFIRRLLDTEDAQIYLTGSSAKLLSREVATSMRGRAYPTEVFPFDFGEALRHQGVEVSISNMPSASQRSKLQAAFDKFLLTGGFPEVQGLSDSPRRRILRDYVDLTILRDVIERHNVGRPLILRRLTRQLLSAPAARFSVNKIYNDFRSQGLKTSKETLLEFMEHLGDAYLLFEVGIHSRSERVRRTNPRKAYAIDPGLIMANVGWAQPSWGPLLENLVFLDLRRHGHALDWYRTESGFEVDFHATATNGDASLVQVCADMGAPQTRKRELRALEEAMVECKITRGTVVTLRESETVATKAGTIMLVPAWLWSLRMAADLRPHG